jgi:hypothetical protein
MNAEAVARHLTVTSSTGREGDPPASAESVRKATKNLPDEDICEAVHELERDGLVHRTSTIGMGAIGFYTLAPGANFFEVFDPIFDLGNPAADARTLATVLVDGDDQAGDVALLAQNFGWTPRRMNPALAILIKLDLVMKSDERHPIWITTWVRRKSGLRHFDNYIKEPASQ